MKRVVSLPAAVARGLALATVLSMAAAGGDSRLPVTVTHGQHGQHGQQGQHGHWAFQPLLATLPPVGAGLPASGDAPANPVDAFIHARLAEAGLTFAPPADKATLLRRVTLDLTGLPPSPGEVASFLQDDAPDAYERLVDRLLASPRHGERWAQHWLDAARFAESDGFEFDHERPDAWRYRDWVIASLNADIAFAGFVHAQIAGDEMFPPQPVATGFLMAGPDMIDINLAEERRHQFLNDMTSTVGEVLLGLSIGCAQCHDHKSDPLSIHDFYRLRAFFDNTVTDPQKGRQLPGFASEAGSRVPASHVCERGDFRRPGDVVQPGFPRVLDAGGQPVPVPDADAPSSMRRSALATWMTRPDNALVCRVMANRLWMHHFGRGIVETPNDFGSLGGSPSHPELLDWLALQLAQREAGFKAVHRLLVTSRTYRQASRGGTPAFRSNLAGDPGNRLFSRMNRRRLSGEEIRDGILSASGALHFKAGGAGVRPPLPAEVRATLLQDQWNVTPEESEHVRRSIYLFVRRNLRFPMFEAFDRPDANASCGRRLVSTTAPQALTLFNSGFSREQADLLADSLMELAASTAERVNEASLRVFARFPTAGEQALAARFLAEQSGALARDGSDRPQRAALADYCLALLNSSEAVYVD